MGKLILLMLGLAAAASLITGLYLLVRHYHRKWYWEDEDRKSRMLKEAMRQAGISYEVDDSGRATPTGPQTPRTSGRAR